MFLHINPKIPNKAKFSINSIFQHFLWHLVDSKTTFLLFEDLGIQEITLGNRLENESVPKQ